MAVLVRAVAGGCRLALRVKPGARRQRLVGAHGDRLKVEVSAPPERGKANAAVVALLADTLEVAASRISVAVGQTSQDKVVELAGVEPETVARALVAAGVPAEAGQ